MFFSLAMQLIGQKQRKASKMLSMEVIKPLCNEDNTILTNHVRVKMKERGIVYDDIETSVLSGEIIAQYEDDKPFPSCMILGYTSKGQPLHAVVSINENTLWIITEYFPSDDVWVDDYKTKKVV